MFTDEYYKQNIKQNATVPMGYNISITIQLRFEFCFASVLTKYKELD